MPRRNVKASSGRLHRGSSPRRRQTCARRGVDGAWGRRPV